MFKVTIFETRRREFYIADCDYDFQAEAQIRDEYDSGEVSLNDRKYIVAVGTTVEEVD